MEYPLQRTAPKTSSGRPGSDTESSSTTRPSTPTSDVSSTKRFDDWRLSVLRYHNAINTRRDVDGSPLIWCPIVKQSLPYSAVTVMHIVPPVLESRHIAYQMRRRDDPEQDKRIFRGKVNGIAMCKGLRDRFRNAKFVIIPAEKYNKQRLSLVLLNKVIGLCRIRVPLGGLQISTRRNWNLGITADRHCQAFTGIIFEALNRL